MKKKYLVMAMALLGVNALMFSQNVTYSEDFETGGTNGNSATTIGFQIWGASILPEDDVFITNDAGNGADGSDWYALMDYSGSTELVRSVDLVSGITYTFSLKYKKEAVNGSAMMGIYSPASVKLVESAPLTSGAWTEVSVSHEATETGTFTFRFYKDWAVSSPNFYIDNFKVVDDQPLSNNKNELVDFSIYPNPVKNVLNIQSEKAIANVQVSDMLGKSVMSQNNGGSVVVSTLPNGIYFVAITAEDGAIGTKKFVKE
jgi:hypothetical protein